MAGEPVSEASIALDDACVDAQLGPVSLRVGAGERLALLGRNGAGKSTLLRMLAGLVAPTSGTVRVRGSLGWVPQSFRASLLPWLSVRDNVALPLRAKPLSNAERDAKIDRALAVVPLDRALLARRPQKLSGGEQQLVVLARAIVATPSIVLFDEPFSALDAIARREIRASLAAFFDETRATLVLVSHDLDDLVLADRALALAGRPGRIVDDFPAVEARARVASLAEAHGAHGA